MELALKVTKAVEKEYEAFQPYRRKRGWGEVPYVPQMRPHLCLTGIGEDGKRYWVKLPAFQGLTKNGPVVGVGDLVQLTAKIKGVSDDGNMTFLNYGKLGAVIDAGIVDLGPTEDPEEADFLAQERERTAA